MKRKKTHSCAFQWQCFDHRHRCYNAVCRHLSVIQCNASSSFKSVQKCTEALSSFSLFVFCVEMIEAETRSDHIPFNQNRTKDRRKRQAEVRNEREKN